MTRGHRPVVAIGEAQRKAIAWGFAVIVLVTTLELRFDFAIDDRGCTSLVRVRRLKYSLFGISDVMRSCAQEIRELRELALPDGVYRELWIRGPDRTWHRYLVLGDGIEVLETGEDRKEGDAPAGSPSDDP
jgi:hypothetical protein